MSIFEFETGSRVGARWPALLLISGLALGLAGPAAADWRIYLSADLGYSVSKGDASGEFLETNGATRSIGGSDTVVSPFLGGALGLAIPMHEIAPLELPRGWRLPDWDVRAEIEAVGLRSYRYKTDPLFTGTNPSGDIITDLDTWSVMANFWVDVPLRGLYKPISWTTARLFGRWRLQTLKQILDRTTWDVGAGLGVAHLDTSTQEELTRGGGDDYNFAWQVGTGLGFALTDRVKLAIGYRYIDIGTAKYRIQGGALNDPDDSFKIDPEIHEARATLRVDVWDFATPWR